MDKILENREFMKANYTAFENFKTDQMKKLPEPILQKPVDENIELIDLIPAEKMKIKNDNLMSNILNRRSHRNFTDEALTLEELSFLLWATQGVKEVIQKEGRDYACLRTVPSAGARHPFETYLVVHNVEGLKPGLYRYLGIEHKLAFLGEIEDQQKKITEAALDQQFAGKCSVVFIWSIIPYRSEWRYYVATHKSALLDAGHICQNLYLACEGIGAGTCAIAAYDQQKTDDLIGVDGKDEYTVYMSPVGKL
jgi:SagB-type dehydrogenase family enzyme